MLSKIQLALYQTWYAKWLIPPILERIDKPLNVFKNNPLKYCDIFGAGAYFIKFYLNCKELHKYFVQKKKYDKGLFCLSDTMLTILAFLGYFIFQGPLVTPLFIALSANLLIKHAYLLSKNIMKELKLVKRHYDNVAADGEADDGFFKKAKLTYQHIMTEQKAHREFKKIANKMLTSSFNVVMSTVTLVFSSLWAIFPFVACVGFSTLGIAWPIGSTLINKYRNDKSSVIEESETSVVEATPETPATQGVEPQPEIVSAYTSNPPKSLFFVEEPAKPISCFDVRGQKTIQEAPSLQTLLPHCAITA